MEDESDTKYELGVENGFIKTEKQFGPPLSLPRDQSFVKSSLKILRKGLRSTTAITQNVKHRTIHSFDIIQKTPQN